MGRLYCLIGLFCLLISTSGWADRRFFPNISDIPLMDGLVVQSTEEVNFDTPVGQIINVEVSSKNISSCRVLSYYQNVLPEMGWEKIEENKFIREKDTLLINVIRKQNPTKLRFEITLNNPIE